MKKNINISDSQIRRFPDLYGYTLIELLVVIAITGVVISVTLSGWTSYQDNKTLDEVCLETVSQLRSIRAKAVNGNKPAVDCESLISYEVDGSTIRACCDNGSGEVCTDFDSLKTNDNVTYTYNDFPVRFLVGSGVVSGGPATIDLEYHGKTNVVTISGSSLACNVSSTPVPTNTDTPAPTNTPASTNTPAPTNTPTPTLITDPICSTCSCSGTSYVVATCNGDTVYVDCNADKCWGQTSSHMYQSEAIDYCSNLNYGGFTDWYLPDDTTLQNLCNSGSCSGTCFNGEGYASTYWSSSLGLFNNPRGVGFSDCLFASGGGGNWARCTR